jgi:hypothetical protein
MSEPYPDFSVDLKKAGQYEIAFLEKVRHVKHLRDSQVLQIALRRYEKLWCRQSNQSNLMRNCP